MQIIFHLGSTVKKLVNTACISACNFVSAFSFLLKAKNLLEHMEIFESIRKQVEGGAFRLQCL